MSKKKVVPPKKPTKGLSAAAEPGGEPLRVQIDRFAVALPLRDMFAAAALAGYLSGVERDDPDVVPTIKQIASDAYRYADAMMEARK